MPKYIIQPFGDQQGVYALLDTEHHDHMQSNIIVTSLAAVFNTDGYEPDGVAPHHCLVHDTVDMRQANELIKNSPVAEWGVDALRKGIEHHQKLNAYYSQERNTAFEWPRSFLTEPAYKLLRKQENGLTEWRRSFGAKPIDWDNLPAHLRPMLTNEQRAQIELYEWEHNPPEIGEKYGLYTAFDTDKNFERHIYRGRLLTSWMGDPLMRIQDTSRPYHMYGKRSYDSPKGYMQAKGVDMHGHIWRGIVPVADGLCCTMRRIK